MPTPGQNQSARPGGPQRPGSAPASGGLGVALDPIKLLRQYAKWLVAAGIVGAVVGVAAHIGLMRVYPLYRSEVTFEMTSPITDASAIITTLDRSEAEIERFIGGQIFLLRSESLLLDAVRNDPSVRNDTQWARAYISPDTGVHDENEMVKDLAGIVQASPIPRSNIVILSATTHVPQDAATIVKAVKDAYRRQLNRDKQTDSQDILAALSSQLRGVQDERRLVEERMDKLLVDNQVTNLEERLMMQAEEFASLQPRVIETRQSLEISKDLLKSYEEQLAAPGGATYPESVRTAVREHFIIRNFESQEANLEATLRSARSRLGERNLQTQQIVNSIAAVRESKRLAEERLLEEKFLELIEMTRSTIRSLEASLVEMQTSIEQARARLADLKRVSEDYAKLKSDQARLAETEARLQLDIESQRAIRAREASSRVRVRYNEEVPTEPIFPKIQFVAPAGVVLTLGLVSGLILLRELLEQRVRSPQDVALIPRARVIGVVPDLDEDPSRPASPERAVHDRPTGVIAESVRQIRTGVLKEFTQRGHKALLVVGGAPGSGASTLITNLAHSLAATDHRVLVIDGNFRRPAMHKHFGVAEAPGLGEALTGAATLADAAQPTDDTHIDVVPAGAPGSRIFERLTTSGMSRLLDEARARYDIVLVDSPPAIVAGDAMALANRCDAALLVVRAYSEKRGLVARVRDQLDESRAEFLGVVVNAVRSSAGGYFKRNYRTAHKYQNGLAEEIEAARLVRARSAAEPIEPAESR